MREWSDTSVASLLTERALGTIVISNQGLCSLNVRGGTDRSITPG